MQELRKNTIDAMHNLSLESNCASCGMQWQSRKPTSYDTGAKSIPIISNHQMIGNKQGEYVDVLLCDLHGRYLSH